MNGAQVVNTYVEGARARVEFPHLATPGHDPLGQREQGDVATVVPFDSWADLDEGPPFRADFVDVHGLNAWQRFLNEMNDVVVRSWDEYRQLLPELSGGGS